MSALAWDAGETLVVKTQPLRNLQPMTATFDSIRSPALELPMKDRYRPVTDLIASDEAVPLQADDGVAEANRRWEQDKDNPDAWLTDAEFVEAVKGARRR